jgi:hypothetical protein
MQWTRHAGLDVVGILLAIAIFAGFIVLTFALAIWFGWLFGPLLQGDPDGPGFFAVHYGLSLRG